VSRPAPARRELALAAVLAVAFGMAPTVGDVGGCGVQASELDARAFALARKEIDCQRCTACGLATSTCAAACDPAAPSRVGWPSSCHPLAHDGDVCLHALRAAGCGDYATFVDDVAPAEPSECDFCHLVPEAGGGGVGEF
jgi:hypothetical protein